MGVSAIRPREDYGSYSDLPHRTGEVKQHLDTPGSVTLLNLNTGRLVNAKKYLIIIPLFKSVIAIA